MSSSSWAKAATGAEQPASSARSSARSAVTAARVAGSSTADRRCANHGPCASAAVVASTASAPWAGAGSITSTGSSSLITASLPTRSSPEAARTTASRSASGPSARFSRVSTLPRIATTSRSGRARSSWAARRGEPVPTRAPSGSCARVIPSRAHSASRGSSRGGAQVSVISSSGAVGRSFQEWTTTSTSPSSSACRTAVTNTPVPPICARGLVRSRSPWVETWTSSTSWPVPSVTAAPTCPDWVSASSEARVPIRSGAALTRRPPRGPARRPPRSPRRWWWDGTCGLRSSSHRTRRAYRRSRSPRGAGTAGPVAPGPGPRAPR